VNRGGGINTGTIMSQRVGKLHTFVEYRGANEVNTDTLRIK